MVVQRKLLPPSGLDFEVYRGLSVECLPVKVVSEAAHRSPATLRKTVRRVADFLAEVAPGDNDGRREAQIGVAEQVAAERMEFLYGCAVNAWRDSQGELTVNRQQAVGGSPPVQVTTVRKSSGDCRYLIAACRLSEMAAKLPISTLGYDADEEKQNEAEENRFHLAAEGAEGEAESFAAASNPPVGDCSDFSDEVALPEEMRAVLEDASPCEMTLSDEIELALEGGESDCSAPVQCREDRPGVVAFRRSKKEQLLARQARRRKQKERAVRAK